MAVDECPFCGAGAVSAAEQQMHACSSCAVQIGVIPMPPSSWGRFKLTHLRSLNLANRRREGA